MPYVKVGPRHQITIPLEVRKEIGIDAGDMLEIISQKGKVLLVPTQMVEKAPVPKLSEEEQKLLLTARRKIEAIKEDMVNSTGLSLEEADVAAKVGIIDPDQKYFWLEEWQKGERAAEKNYKEGTFETFDSAEEFLNSLPS